LVQDTNLNLSLRVRGSLTIIALYKFTYLLKYCVADI